MRKNLVICLSLVLFFSGSLPALAAQITIESIEDTSGSMGTASVSLERPGGPQNAEGYSGNAKGYKAASAIACGSGEPKWNHTYCTSDGLGGASAAVRRYTDLNSEQYNPLLILPTIELIPLYFTYRDGSPVRDAEVERIETYETFLCAIPSIPGIECAWRPAVYSPIVKKSSIGNDRSYFTDDEGKIYLVVVKERILNERTRFTVRLVGDSTRYTSKYDFPTAKANDRVVFDLDSPSVEAARKAAATAKLIARKCTQQTSGVPIKQIPDCSEFAPLPSGQSILVANDPLTYQEQTPNSVIALQGLSEKEVTSVETLTNDFCKSPRVLSGFNWVDKSKVYLSVTTGSEGMCRLKVTMTLGTAYEVQMPVSTWSVSTMRPPTFSGNNLSNRGILQVGKSIQLSNLSFNYSGSTFKVGQVAPVYFSVKNESTCSVDANFLVSAKSSGECVIIIGWPEFAFGSRVYSANFNEYVLFTVKSAAEIAQDAEKKKNERLASIEKAKQNAKQNAKLCSTSDQSRLRNSYAPVVASSRRSSELRSKLSRVDYLISQVGKNGPIQLPPSEYADLLAGYPVLANSRQVPIYVYQAILQGSLIGEGKNYQKALVLATSAYSKASTGCKKVVGKP